MPNWYGEGEMNARVAVSGAASRRPSTRAQACSGPAMALSCEPAAPFTPGAKAEQRSMT